MDHTHSWQVTVEGAPELIDALASFLRTEQACLVPGDQNILTSISFASLRDELAVMNRAEALLRTATAVVNTFANTKGAVRVRSAVCRRPDGGTHGTFTLLDISVTTVDTVSSQQIAAGKRHLSSEIGTSLLATGLDHPRAKEALSYVADGNPSWGNLYSALEAVDRQLRESGSVGKEWSAVERKGWLEGKKLRTLKRVADRHRHAIREHRQPDEMNLVEAQLLVKDVLRKWLVELSVQ